MRFGGHETFAIREGWLHKGLKLLVEEPGKLRATDVADWLGVGRNMGKSIKHWLLATGLARSGGREGRDISRSYASRQARARERPIFSALWDLVGAACGARQLQDHAVTWCWFFNQFSLTRFDRTVCLAGLRAHLEFTTQRVPAQKTLQRDMACLIASYATFFPLSRVIPRKLTIALS